MPCAASRRTDKPHNGKIKDLSAYTREFDTGTDKLESPTVKDITAQREDNPFLRLGVIGGVMGIVCLFLWGIFAFLSTDTLTVVEEEVEVEQTVEAEPDYQAQLAFRDQYPLLR